MYVLKGHQNDRGAYNNTNVKSNYSDVVLIADDGYTRTVRTLVASSFSSDSDQQQLKGLRCVVETAIGNAQTFRCAAEKSRLIPELHSR